MNPPEIERSPLARRLRQARTEKGISQKQLGIRIGIDPSSASPRINQYEQGIHLPDFRIAERLAEALDVSVTYFYADDERLAQMILTFRTLSANQQIQMLKSMKALANSPSS